MTLIKKQKSTKLASIAISFILLTNASLASASEITAKKMVEFTNESRVEAGLGTLTVNNKLEQAAQAKARDMLLDQYFEHTSPDGVTPWHWFNLAGYEYVFAAENLAIDFITAEGAHSALMKSTGHRENILGANYKEIGIAVIEGEFDGKDSIIIVEEFGSQRESRITINNAPFFEEKGVEEISKEKVKTVEKVEPKSAPAQVKVPAQPVETQVIIENIPAVNKEVVTDKRDISISSRTLGKVIPEVYAVKNVQGLKKVYVEDIYWQSAGEEGLVRSLNDSTVKLKVFLRSLTNSILYALL